MFSNTERWKTSNNSRKNKKSRIQIIFSCQTESKSKNIPFNIDVEDIVIPEFCPILNVRLKKNHKGWSSDVPTLDRIVPEIGYVKGNVKVISGKANVMKNNATIEELKTFTQNIFAYLQE